MGGAANDFQRGITAVGTGGFSEVGNIPGTGKIGRNVSSAARSVAGILPTTGFGVPAAIVRAGAGAETLANAPRDAAKIASDSAAEQSRQAAAAEAKLSLQPKKTASDNFLANKNKMLANMRLGLMSSIGAGSTATAPTLSAPSLSGKSKLGA